MVQKFTVFDIKSYNEEMIEEFHEFFYKYNLTPLFNHEHRAGTISVSDLELRSIVNKGKYYRVFTEFADYLHMNDGNKTYDELLFKLLFESNSLGGLSNKIERLMLYINTEIDNDRMFNMWNIVFYNKEVLD